MHHTLNTDVLYKRVDPASSAAKVAPAEAEGGSGAATHSKLVHAIHHAQVVCKT